MTDQTEILRPPSLTLLLLEGRAFWELGAFYGARPWLARAPRGDGHPVMVMPGLAASDRSTGPLRSFLAAQGYVPYGWGMGRNGGEPSLIDPLLRRLERLQREHGGRVSLIGWSLGGLYAREIAKLAPEAVRCVITLGSPFKGPATASNVWRLYEQMSGRPAENPELQRRLDLPPPLPTTSIYTRTDGIVAWQRCIERVGPLAENICVPGSHSGLGHNLLALHAIADRLAQREGEWLPFERRGWRRLAYPAAADLHVGA